MTCKKTKQKRGTKKAKTAKAAHSSFSESQQTSSMEEFNNTVDSSFFYTSDKRLNALDDDEVVMKLVEHYPDFNQQNKDTQLRKLFLTMLDDKPLIDDLLDYYGLDMLDLFKIIYKQYSSLFNTLFIKKVKQKLQDNGYADLQQWNKA